MGNSESHSMPPSGSAIRPSIDAAMYRIIFFMWMIFALFTLVMFTGVTRKKSVELTSSNVEVLVYPLKETGKPTPYFRIA